MSGGSFGVWLFVWLGSNEFRDVLEVVVDTFDGRVRLKVNFESGDSSSDLGHKKDVSESELIAETVLPMILDEDVLQSCRNKLLITIPAKPLWIIGWTKATLSSGCTFVSTHSNSRRFW